MLEWAYPPLNFEKNINIGRDSYTYSDTSIAHALIFMVWAKFNHIMQKYTWFMHPSMGTLNLPSSRVVKDSTPSRRRILRGINYGIGESSPNLFSNMMNLYLVKFEARWILNERAFYYFITLFISIVVRNRLPESSCESQRENHAVVVPLIVSPVLPESGSWARRKKSAWWIFTRLNFRGGESWPNW